jgi:hypothetical protein
MKTITVPPDRELRNLEKRLLKMARDGKGEWAYFVLAGAFVKIGVSRSVRVRLGLYRTATAEQARLIALCPGGAETEARLHKRLARHRYRGEWFRLHPELVRIMRWEGMWPGGVKFGDAWPDTA